MLVVSLFWGKFWCQTRLGIITLYLFNTYLDDVASLNDCYKRSFIIMLTIYFWLLWLYRPSSLIRACERAAIFRHEYRKTSNTSPRLLLEQMALRSLACIGDPAFISDPASIKTKTLSTFASLMPGQLYGEHDVIHKTGSTALCQKLTNFRVHVNIITQWRKVAFGVFLRKITLPWLPGAW